MLMLSCMRECIDARLHQAAVDRAERAGRLRWHGCECGVCKGARVDESLGCEVRLRSSLALACFAPVVVRIDDIAQRDSEVVTLRSSVVSADPVSVALRHCRVRTHALLLYVGGEFFRIGRQSTVSFQAAWM